jgi:peptidoglycan/LPS O-acetylase OafA/YrhL
MGSLRFILALAVAAGHAASFFGFAANWILPGSRAVQIFYIISGFLMAMILNGKYADTPRGNWLFYSNRLLKIYVPYLAILFVTVIICLVAKAATGNAILLQAWFANAQSMTFPTWAFAVLTNIFIFGQEWGYLLIYRAGSLFYSLQAFAEPPAASQFIIIGPAWTLSIELTFYLIAPFILRRHVLLIAALAYVSYFLRFEGYHVGYYSEATNYRFFLFELSLFLYGAICFRLGKFLLAGEPRWSTAITVVMLVTIICLTRYSQHLLANQYELYAIVGIVLPTLFDFSRRHTWDRSLGDLSYPLYLVHWPVVAFLAAIVRALQPDKIGTVAAYPILATMAAIAVSIVINRYLVDPVDEWRQRRAKDGADGRVQATTVAA